MSMHTRDTGVLPGQDSAANLPEMLQAAVTYLKTGDRRVADIWVCSDRQQSDWRPESPRWRQVAGEWRRLGEGVRLHLLVSTGRSSQCLNHRVGIHWVETRQGREFALSATVTREDEASMVIPVRVAVGGLTQLVDVQIDRGRGRLEDFRVKATADAAGVFGKLSIPADLDAADDQWFFAVASDPNRPIGLVKEECCAALEAVSEVLGRPVFGMGGGGHGPKEQGSRLKSGRFPVDEMACLIWQGRLPEGGDADEVTRYLSGGGSVVFFPPKQPHDEIEQRPVFQGVRWMVGKGIRSSERCWINGTIRFVPFVRSTVTWCVVRVPAQTVPVTRLPGRGSVDRQAACGPRDGLVLRSRRDRSGQCVRHGRMVLYALLSRRPGESLACIRW